MLRISWRFVIAALFVLASSDALAEWTSIGLSEITMKGQGGERLVIRAAHQRLASLELSIAGKRWEIPSSALNVEFVPSLDNTIIYQDGFEDAAHVLHHSVLVEIKGMTAGPDGTKGELTFEFENGRLLERTLTTVDDNGEDLGQRQVTRY